MSEENLGPAIILVEPQLGENIGMAARAMLNCGLRDLRLVRPRDGWPNGSARAAAKGAVDVIDNAQLFDTTENAIADLTRVYATTARPRDMIKRVVTPRQAAREMRAAGDADGRSGILFGRESMGLDNDDVALADTVLTVPVSAELTSLNLAQAVFIASHEWFLAGDDTPDEMLAVPKETRPANKEELIGLFEHLEQELDACGFLRVAEKRPTMVRNIRNIFQRAELTEQEVRTLRGVVKGLARNDKD